MTKEERIEKAVNFFKEGYNCSQSGCSRLCRFIWFYA